MHVCMHARAETSFSNIPQLRSWNNFGSISIDLNAHTLGYAPAKANEN